MKNLIKRSTSGLIYITLIISSMLLGQVYFAFVFLIFSIIANYEFIKLGKKKAANPSISAGLLFGITIYISIQLYLLKYFNAKILLINIPLFIAIPIIELFRNNQNSTKNIAHLLSGALYTTIPTAMLSYIYNINNEKNMINIPPLLLSYFIILWLNDTGAYIFGSIIGKHKLCKRISPQKTWEGFIGGIAISLLFSYLFFSSTKELTVLQSIIYGLIIVIFGTLGDLVESMIKRDFKIKDSGKIMPGHGGVLDRIDSILLSSPMIILFIYLLKNTNILF